MGGAGRANCFRYQEKLQELDGAFGINPSQLVDVAFKVFNRVNKERRCKQNATFWTAILDSQKASYLKRGKLLFEKEHVLPVRRTLENRLPSAKP